MAQQAAVLAEQEWDLGTLPTLVRQHASQRPQSPAIVPANAPIVTYSDLVERMDVVGRVLREAGIGRDSYVAVLLPNGDTLASALVSVFSHAIVVPLDPRLTGPELEDLCRRVRIDAILSDGKSQLPGGEPVRRVALEELGQGLELAIFRSPDDGDGEGGEQRTETTDSLAMVLRTSGTTAVPKLVPLSHGNLVARAAGQRHYLRLTTEDRAFCVAPLHYAHGLETALWAPMTFGFSIACPPPTEDGAQSGEVLKWLAELEPTYYAAGPTFHRSMLDHVQALGGKPRHSLRGIQSAGAPLQERERAELEAAFGVPVMDSYGSSETGQMSSNGLYPEERRPGTVGRPYEWMVALQGDDGSVMEPGKAEGGSTGEIVVRGPIVVPGYLEDDGSLTPVVKDGWFHTGDIGVVDADGFLTVSGRLKDIINRGGEKIAPAEVDKELLQHPDVVEAAAFGVPHQRLGEDLAAAVVLREGAEVTALDLRHYLNARLVSFKVPRRIHLVPELPKGATGKVSRVDLAKQIAARPQKDAGGMSSSLEFDIMALWARMLERDDIGPNDDFFELGGDSLLAVEMRRELERLVGREVPESLLFEAATPRQLVTAIVANEGSTHNQLVPVRAKGDKQPLLFFDGDLTGGGYYMRRVAQQLEPDRPLWLLRPYDIKDNRLPTVEAMASHYLKIIREAGFKPPYLFGGHCNGALAALETAHQAEASGEKVDLVVLVDPISLNARRKMRVILRALRLYMRLRSSKARKREEKLGFAMSSVWTAAQSPPWRRKREEQSNEPGNGPGNEPVIPVELVDDDLIAEFDRQNEMRVWTYRRTMAQYMPKRVKAKLVCLTAAHSQPLFFDEAPWSRFGSDFESHTLPGGHLTCLTEGINALGEKLRAALAKF